MNETKNLLSFQMNPPPVFTIMTSDQKTGGVLKWSGDSPPSGNFLKRGGIAPPR